MLQLALCGGSCGGAGDSVYACVDLCMCGDDVILSINVRKSVAGGTCTYVHMCTYQVWKMVVMLVCVRVCLYVCV